MPMFYASFEVLYINVKVEDYTPPELKLLI